MTGPGDEQLDASCFDEERHRAFYGFGLNTDYDERGEVEREDELDQDDED